MSEAHRARLAELKSKGELTETEKDEVRLIESFLATLEPAPKPEPKVEEPAVSSTKVEKKKKGKK